MLVRYNPLRALVAHRREPRFLDEPFLPTLWGDLGNLIGPETNLVVKEEKKNYLIQADLPGYAPEEVTAELKDGVLTLRAEHNDEKWDQNEKEGWRSIETRRGAFYRSIPLPEDVNPEEIKAEVKNGVLRITLPKDSKKPNVKRIEIQ